MLEVDSKVSDEIGRIELALDLILAAIQEHRRLREAGRVQPVTVPAPICLAELMKMEFSPVEDLLNDPVGAAHRRAIKELGRRLFALGGTALMGRVCDRVAEMGGNWDRRITILNARWDGIGDTTDRWLA